MAIRAVVAADSQWLGIAALGRLMCKCVTLLTAGPICVRKLISCAEYGLSTALSIC